MAMILKDLLDEARARRSHAPAIDTLKVYRLVLEAAPLDFDLRLEIGDLFMEKEQTKLACAVYNAVATFDIKAGNPLRAMVAIKLLQGKGINVSRLLDGLMDYYCVESSIVGRSIKLAPTDYSQAVREDINLNYEVDRDKFIVETAAMAADTQTIKNFPKLVPPVPIFSALNRDAFRELNERLILTRYRQGERIVTEGDPGDAVYFIARGEVSVVKEQEAGGFMTLARLGPGSLLGEMALLSDAPRSASVVCDADVDALELPRRDVEELSGRLPHVAGAMNRFMSERMILNLLATNPLFAPFGDKEKKQLLARFKGHDVPAGTIFLEEGDMGRGLYVILQGRASITKQKDGRTIPIAEISAGDIVGEMSLVHEMPVSATVKTITSTTLLFLARELFLPLIEAVPELKVYFEELAVKRAIDTQTVVQARTAVEEDIDVEDPDAPDEAAEDEEEILDLSDDEMILI